MPGHVVSMRLYLVIFITLLFLTALTTAEIGRAHV